MKKYLISGICILINLLCFVFMKVKVQRFNNIERMLVFDKFVSQEYLEKSDLQLSVVARGGSKDAWIKRIVNDDGSMDRFAGITYDITVTNNTKFKVVDWTAKVFCDEPYYLNNAWCGFTQVHQNNEEIVQQLDLRRYIEEHTQIELNHFIFQGDLFIPIKDKDYFVYVPSKENMEDEILPSNKNANNIQLVRVGFIVYKEIDETEKIDLLDFSNVEISYKLSTTMLHLKSFWVSCVILVLLIISMFVMGITDLRVHYLLARREKDKKIIEQAIETFTGFIDAKDTNTNGHSVRVAVYSRKIAQELGFNQEECENIYYIGMMHDCGKIGIPDSILCKPGKLRSDEYEIIKRHTIIGNNILSSFTAIEGIRDGAHYHHERYDGKGYPEGLKGEEIPLIARIVSVADAFDAMHSVRCYRQMLSKAEVLKEFTENSGKQFDPKIVDCLLKLIEKEVIEF